MAGKTECPFCHTIPNGDDVVCGSQLQARGCAWLTTALLRQPKRPFGAHDPIERLRAERDHSVKARLMAEKDLEMALIDVEELRGLLREARDELNVVASYKDDPSVNAGLRSTARAYDKLVMRIDAALTRSTIKNETRHD